MSESPSTPTPTAEADPVAATLRILAELPPKARTLIRYKQQDEGDLEEVLRTALEDTLLSISQEETVPMDVLAGWVATVTRQYAEMEVEPAGGEAKAPEPVTGQADAPAEGASKAEWVKALAEYDPELLAKMALGDGETVLFDAVDNAVPNTPEGWALLVDTLKRAEALNAATALAPQSGG